MLQRNKGERIERWIIYKMDKTRALTIAALQ